MTALVGKIESVKSYSSYCRVRCIVDGKPDDYISSFNYKLLNKNIGKLVVLKVKPFKGDKGENHLFGVAPCSPMDVFIFRRGRGK